MEVFWMTQVTDSSPLIHEVYIEIYLDGTFGISHPTSQQKSNRRDPRMSSK
jgi:hypothetical protein